jgi:hypothetical protein
MAANAQSIVRIGKLFIYVSGDLGKQFCIILSELGISRMDMEIYF